VQIVIEWKRALEKLHEAEQMMDEEVFDYCFVKPVTTDCHQTL
jgi:hypothetical protein